MEDYGEGDGEEPMAVEEKESEGDLPLPPPPAGLKLPTPPPPPSLPLPPPPVSIESDVISKSEIETNDDVSSSPEKDFQSVWNQKVDSDSLNEGNRERMYGHIDRIASGEVGTLLDRFSDRFGSELDREIIVLRKKQQQAIRDIKPTVELISPPTVEIEIEVDSSSDESESTDDLFPTFFDVVNNLLGNMSDDFVNAFIASDDFTKFQKIGEDPSNASEEDRTTFFSMINRVLGDLPDDKINEFVESPDFILFQTMSELYGA
ncbi:MAG: hypothetical protein P8Q35_05755 [Candidatus Thalassarchaeaceae archaeon]|nr:hypothetical protein [Candidatus Thalassarchaeaceae archaeon]